MTELERVDPQYIFHKIDWEGWPDALEWLTNYDYGDSLLNGLVAEAAKANNVLEGFRRRIEERAEELGAESGG